MQNLIGCQQHGRRREFVCHEVQGLLTMVAIREWGELHLIRVINGFVVMVDRKEKKRLVLDAQSINIFHQYGKFEYERLSDVATLVMKEDVIAQRSFLVTTTSYASQHISSGFQFDRHVHSPIHLSYGLSNTAWANIKSTAAVFATSLCFTQHIQGTQ